MGAIVYTHVNVIANVWLELLTMSFPTIPTDLIEAIIDWVALLEPGLK